MTLSDAPTQRARMRAAAPAALLAGLLALYVVRSAVNGDGQTTLDDWLYTLLVLAAAVFILARAVLFRAERTAWLVLGLGVLAWGAGDAYFTFALADDAAPPFPSAADAGYLMLYPAACVTLWLLARERIELFERGLLMDGLIAGLSVTSLAAALAFQPIADASSGSTAAVLTNLAYPIGDMLLAGVAVGIIALTGWRPGRTWLLLVAGLVVAAVADGVFLYEVATGTYAEGALWEALWPAAMLLIAAAAWQPGRRFAGTQLEGARVFAVPAAFGLVGIAVLVRDHFIRVNDLALVLSGLVLGAVTVRMAMLVRQNVAMLARSRREALTDPLTGLGNRRRLMADLREGLERATASEPLVLILFDLDGFKQYNDTFGHPAGDALLARLGAKLRSAAAPYGRAYRMGGDEFCALVSADGLGIDAISASTAAALSEHGDGFSVTASQGRVLVPQEADDATVALQVADTRMYANKGSKPTSPRLQTRDVLLQALRERTPDLDEHLHGVADLALRVGQLLGLSSEELDEIARAAELHDVGKMAIPDAILSKPGPLDEDEWAFMRRHTVLGERILAVAPALAPVARLVRSSHEHFDGSGYPDGLAGSAIPLGSRVILVCDAYHAMVTDRPYRRAMSHEDALAELRRCAGTQFDPDVVAAFCEAVERPLDASGAREAPAGGR